jgi:hypothetical protein
MSNTVARAIEQTCFVCKETTTGTPVYPTEAAEKIIAAGYVDINQQPTYTNSEEINNSLDLLERFQDQVGAGSFTIPTYFRPSGTAGTAPMAKVLFESLMGVETTAAVTSVTYSQATTKPSFTLWTKKGHTVFFGAGACCEAGKINFTNKGGAKVDFSGGFMRMGWAGTDAVDGAVAESNSVTVTDGKKFTANAYVQIGDDTNTGAGYKISSVSGNVLTMADSITCDDAAVIKGYLPEFTCVGTPMESKETSITLDAAATNLKSLSLYINSPVAWQTDEITTSGYVASYVEDRRNITMTIDMLFRENDLDLFYDGLNDTSTAVVATIGSTAGKIITINLPYSVLEVPKISTSAPTVSLSVAGTALGSSGEDSCSIAFT